MSERGAELIDTNPCLLQDAPECLRSQYCARVERYSYPSARPPVMFEGEARPALAIVLPAEPTESPKRLEARDARRR